MKTIGNRFAEMENVGENLWVVINLVTGVPVHQNGKEKHFSYKGAKIALWEIYNHYLSIEKGR